ncbi:cell division transport system permease protein [Sphingomonas aerophila]|uniref:Cell division transport system permease protein n=2 Tax=Sphingomonas aerophila TaxID=1344948 RepID=A0A7W9BA65_9SPHN|nr:cell division transport system permease protein [Sphingomonas aerophila]
MSAGTHRRVLDEAGGMGAMTGVMAIMLFLTVLSAATGLGTAAAARLLDRDLAGRLTVQVVKGDPASRDAAATRITAALRASTDVVAVSTVPRAELARLLRPWLGDDAGDAALPVPALIDIQLRDPGDTAADRVAALVAGAVPDARVDRHQAWMSPVNGAMRTVVLLALGLVLLMAAATAAVVVLAARAGLQFHRATIDVMHMLGATDVQIARLFQRRIALDAAFGGVVGGAAALGVTAALQAQMAALGSELLGSTRLGTGDWVLLALLPLCFVALATFAARLAVLRALGRTL